MSSALDQAVVVLAEDDPATGKLAEVAVSDLGSIAEFTVVKDGVELLSYLRREGEHQQSKRPHLVLLDLNMPRMNGIEALQAIREDDGLRDLIRGFELGTDTIDVSAIADSIDDLAIANVTRGDGSTNWISVADRAGETEFWLRFAEDANFDASNLTEDSFVF